MADFNGFFASDRNLFFFCSALMVLYQIVLFRGHRFYNFSKEMEKHTLNRKYHVNRNCSANLERINRLYGLSNISAILLSCIAASLLEFKTAILLLAILFILFNAITTSYLGKQYGS